MFYSFALTWNSAGGKRRKNLSNSLTSFDQKKTDSLLLDLLLLFYKPRLENKENKLQTHCNKRFLHFGQIAEDDVWIFWTTVFKKIQIWQIAMRLGWFIDLGEHRKRLGWFNDMGENRKLSFISRLWVQFFWNAGGILRFRLVGLSPPSFLIRRKLIDGAKSGMLLQKKRIGRWKGDLQFWRENERWVIGFACWKLWIIAAKPAKQFCSDDSHRPEAIKVLFGFQRKGEVPPMDLQVL